MYNILLFLALLTTLYGSLANTDLTDDFSVHITVPFILLSTTTIAVAAYAPTVLKEFKLITSTNSSDLVNKSNKTDDSKKESHHTDDIELQQ